MSAGDCIGSAVGLSFLPTSDLYQTAHVSEYLTNPAAVQLNRISANAGDRITVAVDTSPYGGGLNSYLRIFQDIGGGAVRQIASNDDYRGRDAGLTFRAIASGLYYVGVSRFDNTGYDPLAASSGAGPAQGRFDLVLTKTAGSATSDLVGSSFRAPEVSVRGATITVDYAIENRGSLASDPTTASLIVSGDDRFGTSVSPTPSVMIPALAAGDSYSGSFAFSLDSPNLSQAFLGLQIGSKTPVSPARGNDWTSVRLLEPVAAPPPNSNATRETAAPITLDSHVSGVLLPSGDRDFFEVVLTRPGNLAVRVEANGSPTALTLYDAQRIPIVQSEGRSAADPGPYIVHGLKGGPENGGTIYYLEVANLGSETHYDLTTLFTPSDSTPESLPTGSGTVSILRGDFNGDGVLDFITGNTNRADGSIANDVTVFTGNGDGTFQKAGSFSLGIPPTSLVVGDFNGDGRLDLAATFLSPGGAGTQAVRILLGNGDGTFQAAPAVTTPGGSALAVGDFNGDGNLDLALANPNSGTVSFLLNDGHGNFSAGGVVSVPGQLSALTVGDFNGDGRLDLAVSDLTTDRITVLLNDGNGAFHKGGTFATGDGPFALVSGDFNGDGVLDLASANIRSNDVSVLLGGSDLGRANGTFQTAKAFAVGDHPQALVTGDFNGDGRLDLAAANTFSNTATVLLNDGNGGFSGGAVAVGVGPFGLAVGDFDGDGHVDLASANYDSRSLTVLLGHGDGTFPASVDANTTGHNPVFVARGDFNGDGRPDLAVANQTSNDVTILLGQGDGTFRNAGTFAVGKTPKALVIGDFNGDGRLDLATANYGSNDVTVLLGDGTGGFQTIGSYQVGRRPTAIVAADFSGDGNLDLVTADSASDQVSVLHGRGDGTFVPARAFATGAGPHSLAVGNFAGDGHLDLAVADYDSQSQDITILQGDGHGSFAAGPVTLLDRSPASLVAGNFAGGTRADLAFATGTGVSLLSNTGDGHFGNQTNFDLGAVVSSLVANDFNGDGHLDIAAADELDSTTGDPVNKVTVLLGDGAGGFTPSDPIPVGNRPSSLVAGDFNGDGRPDLATANYAGANVTVLLGTGTGSFVPPVLAPSPVRSTPIVAKLLGSAVPDVVVLTETGKIEFRRGLAAQPGAFAPPVVLNPDAQFAARDLTLVQTDGGFLLAALDANQFDSANGPKVSRVTLYRPHADGTFSVAGSVELPAGFLPANIASADLTGDGLGDLVISAASDKVFVSLQTTPGVFARVARYDVGVNPSSIVLKDANGDSHADIVVTDRFSGQVSVLLNEGAGTFFPEERFRAGTGLYGLTPVNGIPAVHSLEGTTDVVAGLFDQDAFPDLVVINSDAKSFSLLRGTGDGGFLNPEAASTVFLGATPTAIVAGHFISGDDNLDLAVLSSESHTVTIFRGDGRGGFVKVFAVDAGNRPTGLKVADVSRPGGGGPDGIQDLLIGNAFGDLLIVTGNGDGTFSQYRRADQSVSLAVAASPVSRRSTFFFSNKGRDRLAYATVAAGKAVVSNPTIFQDRTAGIQAPGPQAVVTVGGTQYLLVANSGANDLLVYQLDPNGRPLAASKQTYSTGTDPVSITTTTAANDLNGDGIADVVIANQGSNDVSIFLGQMTNGTWTLTYRPRQSSGGLGPTSVAIADATGVDRSGTSDGIPDLLVSNGQSDQVSVLAGRGNGYFINRSNIPIRTGRDPVQVLVGNFDGGGGLDLVTINRGSNDITLVSNFLTNPVTSTVSSGGTLPVSAVAFDDNGSSDLLVANVGDGTLEWLRGGAAGLEVMSILASPDLPHLSGLALVVTANGVDVYGTDASREVAALLGTFGPSSPSTNFVPQSPGFSSGLEIVTEGGSEATTPAGTLSALHAIAAGDAGLQVFAIGFVGRSLNAASFPAGVDGATDSPDGDSEIKVKDTRQPPAKGAGILLLNLGEPDANDDRPGVLENEDETAHLRGESDARADSPRGDVAASDLVWSAMGAWQRPAGHFAALELSAEAGRARTQTPVLLPSGIASPAKAFLGPTQESARPDSTGRIGGKARLAKESIPMRIGEASGADDLLGDTSRAEEAPRGLNGRNSLAAFVTAAFWNSFRLICLPHRRRKEDDRR